MTIFTPSSSIQAQLSTFYILSVLVLAVIASTTTSWRAGKHVETYIQANVSELARILASNSSGILSGGASTLASAKAGSILDFPDVVYVAITSPDKRELLGVGENPFPQEDEVFPVEGVKRLVINERADHLVFTAPVFAGGVSQTGNNTKGSSEGFLGTVHVVLAKKTLRDVQKSIFFETLISFFVIAVLLLLLLLLFVSRRVSDPLKKLTAIIQMEFPEFDKLQPAKQMPFELRSIYFAFQEKVRRIADQDRAQRMNQEQLEILMEVWTDELIMGRDEALAASQAKTAFISNMSHELRTPLQAIIGYCDIILPALPGSDPLAERIGKIRLSGQHLLSLIDNILDLSKIEAGRIKLDYEVLSIPALIDEVRSTVESILLNGNKFIIDIKPDILFMKTDATKLRQILFNLITNANKYTFQGVITLIINRTSSGLLRFIVKDTGLGIAEDQLEQIFQKFYRIQAEANEKYRGAGIGLALARQLSSFLGGDIQVKSEEGRGSVFTVVLPGLVEEGPASLVHKSSARQKAQPLTILLAEDNAVAQDIFFEVIQSAGHQCVIVADGQAALDCLLSHDPPVDLAILDYGLPDLTGLEVFRQYLDLGTRRIPTIIITAGIDEEVRRELAKHDLTLMIKPVVPERLLKAIYSLSKGQQHT